MTGHGLDCPQISGDHRVLLRGHQRPAVELPPLRLRWRDPQARSSSPNSQTLLTTLPEPATPPPVGSRPAHARCSTGVVEVGSTLKAKPERVLHGLADGQMMPASHRGNSNTVPLPHQRRREPQLLLRLSHPDPAGPE